MLVLSLCLNLTVFATAFLLTGIHRQAFLRMSSINSICGYCFGMVVAVNALETMHDYVHDSRWEVTRAMQWTVGHLIADAVVTSLFPGRGFGGGAEVRNRLLMIAVFTLSLRFKKFMPFLTLFLANSANIAIFSMRASSHTPLVILRNDTPLEVILRTVGFIALSILVYVTSWRGVWLASGWNAVLAAALAAANMFISIKDNILLVRVVREMLEGRDGSIESELRIRFLG